MRDKIVTLFETDFTNSTLNDACDLIMQLVYSRTNFIYIAVKDVALTVRSLESKELHDFYHHIPQYTFVDGKGILYASFLLKKPLKEMVGGPGIYYEILKRGAVENIRFYFLGADRKNLELAINNIRKRNPCVNIVGYHHGYFSSSEEKKIIDDINTSNCDVLFLAMPTPKREIFIKNNYKDFNPFVCIPIGGVLDVEAGITKFAPFAIRMIGLEWFYRVIQEPRRLAKRYFYTHTKFIYYFFKEYLK